MSHFLRNANRPTEPLWHVQLTMLFAIILQLLLPVRFAVGAHYLLPFVEALLLVTLAITTPKERIFKSISRRINVLLLIVLSGIANSYALIMVAQRLLQSGVRDGQELILTAVNIYITNIILFALFYWEMDGGGPGERLAAPKHQHDFLFPQDQNESYKHPQWQPIFIDYLYVSATNAMAFSPTDTMPLSRRAKFMMLAQATVSLVAVALVAARAVNILH